jgi:AbrB family looped-hinge helix DNA binding protein
LTSKGRGNNIITGSILTLGAIAMKITSKGQVTIPQAIREEMGFWPLTEIEFVRQGNRVYLKKAEGDNSRGRQLVQRLQGKASVKMSTDQILALTRGD